MKTNKRDSTASLPADLRKRMALSGLLPSIRSLILPTMKTVAERFQSRLDDYGWIDMKFDPVDGTERDSSQENYRKDRVYGWIQGRGLESLTAHIRWTGSLPGYELLDAVAMNSCGEALYRNLLSSCFSTASLSVSFVMDTAGKPVGQPVPKGVTTLTHLFVLRGLLAFASYRDYADDLECIVPALRKAVDDSIRGQCLNDQLRFGTTGGECPRPGRIGYEGQMIAIGACELLALHTKADEDIVRGIDTINSVLSRHSRIDLKHGLMLADGIYSDGKPYREDGRLVTDPGHALEFVGLSLQFFRHTAPLTGNANHWSAFGQMTGGLRTLASVYNRLGRAPHGGLMKSIDAETGEPLNGDCPWWSSYEAVRTWAELLELARDDAARAHCIAQLNSYVACIQKLYVKPSSINVPVQTVDFEGKVVPVIPATPDIDPGYHTGIPLIDAYELLGAQSTMLCGLGESLIPTALGSRLQGHLARSAGAERDMDPLYARCCWISTAKEQLLLLSADVLEFSHDWSSSFSSEVAATWGIPEERIILLATHTHTAPSTMELGLLKEDSSFLSSLGKAFESAIRSASSRLVPMVGIVGSVELEGIGINRRKMDPASGLVSMKPNTEGERDDTLSSFFLFDAKGKLKGLLANMAVHPTTLGVSLCQISADYPGRLVRELKKRLGSELIAIPIQGACGDIRPMVVDATGNEFIEGSERDIDRIGVALASGVLDTLDSELNKGLWIEGGNLSFSTKNIELPFNTLPVYEEIERFAERTREELEELKNPGPQAEGFAGSHENPLLIARTYLAWAEKLLKASFDADRRYIGKRGVPASFSCWSLGRSLVFFTLPGEAFCRIGKSLKTAALPSAAMVCGYCGGSVGYIPTSDAFKEGGYEVESAFRFYGFPAPLAADTGKTIIELFESMRV